MPSMRRVLYLSVAFITLAIGAVGVFFPVLPTTPFLLIASYCFARGSTRLNLWFTGTKLYKNHLESFVTERAMTLSQKIKILLFADMMIAIPIVLVDSLLVKGILISVIVIKLYYFIFKVKTLPKL